MKKTVVSFLLFVCMCVCLKKSEKPFVLFLKKKITSPVKYFLYLGHLTNMKRTQIVPRLRSTIWGSHKVVFHLGYELAIVNAIENDEVVVCATGMFSAQSI